MNLLEQSSPGHPELPTSFRALKVETCVICHASDAVADGRRWRRRVRQADTSEGARCTVDRIPGSDGAVAGAQLQKLTIGGEAVPGSAERTIRGKRPTPLAPPVVG